MGRRWKDLATVETIYEADREEDEEEEEKEVEDDIDTLSNPLSSLTHSPDSIFSSVFLSSTPSSRSPSTPLQAIINEWSKAKACKCNVVIRVQSECFHLHREPMTIWSRYLRRRLTEFYDVTVSPPLSITAEAFTHVARFCYGWAPVLTPSNVAAIRAAAELLEMDEGGTGNGSAGAGGLIRLTEEYFRKEVAGNEGIAAELLRSCTGLLPEGGGAPETLAARCVETLMAAPESVGGGQWIVGLMELPASAFGMIAESMANWSAHDHDHLYGIVDQYFEFNKEKLSEEEKARICSEINSSNLSQNHLLHLVRNPRLPLRFVLQAMLLDQLQSRRRRRRPTAFATSISGNGSSSSTTTTSASGVITIANILEHGAAERQAAQLRASMESTALRIESLERDVAGLRCRLRWSEEKRAEMESSRSESFRVLRGAPPPAERNRKKGRGFGWGAVSGVIKKIFRPSRKDSASGDFAEQGGKRPTDTTRMMNKYLSFY